MPRAVIGSATWGPALNADLDGIEALANSKGPPSAPTTYTGDAVVLNPGTVSTFNGSAGWTWFQGLYMPKATAITAVSAEITGAVAGATLNLCRYTRTGASAWALADNFGTMDTSTVGVKTLTGTWTLPAGVIWMTTLASHAQTIRVTFPPVSSKALLLPFGQIDVEGTFGYSGLAAGTTPISGTPGSFGGPTYRLLATVA